MGYVHTDYVFTFGGTTISWRSTKTTKQTLVGTSLNHDEILALYEAASECTRIRAVVEHIQGTCGLSSLVDIPTTILEDNIACKEQTRKGYIKRDHTK